MIHKNKLSMLIASALLLAASCNKNDFPPTPEPVKPAQGLYVLNEGYMRANNATLSYYDFTAQKVTNEFYKSVNGEKLGDTGNDAIIYGSKMYIVVNNSNLVAVVDKQTGKLIAKITSDKNWQPRHIVPYQGKVLVTGYNGKLSVIDTATLKVEKAINVGADPEGVATVGDMAYVVNSGGRNPVPDSTVSVVDLNKGEEIKKIVVGINPYMIAEDNRKLYVTAREAGWVIKDYVPKITVIDSKTNSVVKTIDRIGSKMAIYKNNLYSYNYSYTTQKNEIYVIDTKADKLLKDNFITDGTEIKIPYGIDIDESNGNVYICDLVASGQPGVVYCFDQSGKKKFSISLAPQGYLPNKVLFVR